MTSTPFADRFVRIRRLGVGSSADVWLAYDLILERKVALKLFRAGTDNVLAYDEARLLTKLEGEHILPVYDAQTFDDVPYIATRVAAGGTAERLLEQHPFGIRPDQSLTLIRHLLVGLDSCHARNLVHRDVKPANLFLDGTGRGLAGDFGLMRLTDHTGAVPAGGTERVRAPEMFDTGRGGKQSDIYSVGVTFYRLLTGEWPFETVDQVLAGDFVGLRIAAPHVPARLASRVERAMAVDSSTRYQHVSAMHQALADSRLLPRVWQRRAPHDGHEGCWYEDATSQRSGTGVCLIRTPKGRFQTDVRRATPTRPRITAFCLDGIREGDVAKRLRGIFDHI